MGKARASVGAIVSGAAFLVTTTAGAQPPVVLAPEHLAVIGKTDERYQSYNLDLAAITGKAPRTSGANGAAGDTAREEDAKAHLVLSGVALEEPLDLANRRLRMLAAALGPAYLRVSGTAANSVWFQDEDEPVDADPPEGYGSVLTRAQWSGVLGFAKAADAKLLTSFTVNAAVRDANGAWTPKVAERLVSYTYSVGGEIDAAELFNEPNLPSYGGAPKGYNAQMFAQDQAAFRAFAARAAPRMKIVGPGDVVTANFPLPGGITGALLMEGQPQPRFDVISYHFYPAVAARCAPANSPVGTTPEKALSEEWLASTDVSFQSHKALRDKYAPGAPIWNTETAGAACSGAEWDTTFLDTFRYLDQLGRLARQGASAVFHQTLVGGNYGLLNPKDFSPRPNYWGALLWHRLMGSRVLNAGEIQAGFHLYAHCQADRSGKVAVMAINNGDQARAISAPGRKEIYRLTADTLQSRTVRLNGSELTLGRSGLPPLHPIVTRGASVDIPARTIAFIAFPQANNTQCL